MSIPLSPTGYADALRRSPSPTSSIEIMSRPSSPRFGSPPNQAGPPIIALGFTILGSKNGAAVLAPTPAPATRLATGPARSRVKRSHTSSPPPFTFPSAKKTRCGKEKIIDSDSDSDVEIVSCTRPNDAIDQASKQLEIITLSDYEDEKDFQSDAADRMDLDPPAPAHAPVDHLSHLLEHRRFLLEAHEERPAEANREEYLDFHYAGQPRSPESSKQAEASYQGFCLHGEPALGSEEYPVYDPSNPTGAQRSSSNVRTSSDEGAARAPVASGSGLARNATGVIYLSDSDSENSSTGTSSASKPTLNPSSSSHRSLLPSHPPVAAPPIQSALRRGARDWTVVASSSPVKAGKESSSLKFSLKFKQSPALRSPLSVESRNSFAILPVAKSKGTTTKNAILASPPSTRRIIPIKVTAALLPIALPTPPHSLQPKAVNNPHCTPPSTITDPRLSVAAAAAAAYALHDADTTLYTRGFLTYFQAGNGALGTIRHAQFTAWLDTFPLLSPPTIEQIKLAYRLIYHLDPNKSIECVSTILALLKPSLQRSSSSSLPVVIITLLMCPLSPTTTHGHGPTDTAIVIRSRLFHAIFREDPSVDINLIRALWDTRIAHMLWVNQNAGLGFAVAHDQEFLHRRTVPFPNPSLPVPSTAAAPPPPPPNPRQTSFDDVEMDPPVLPLPPALDDPLPPLLYALPVPDDQLPHPVAAMDVDPRHLEVEVELADAFDAIDLGNGDDDDDEQEEEEEEEELPELRFEQDEVEDEAKHGCLPPKGLEIPESQGNFQGMVALLVRLGYEVVIDAFSVTAHVCAQLKRENSATAAVGVRSSSPWLNSLVRLFNFGMHLKFVIASHPAERPCHLLQACIMQLFVVGHLEAHATLSRIYRLAVDMIQVHRPGFAYLDFPALLASLDYATDSDLSTNQLDLADCSAKLIDRINTNVKFAYGYGAPSARDGSKWTPHAQFLRNPPTTKKARKIAAIRLNDSLAVKLVDPSFSLCDPDEQRTIALKDRSRQIGVHNKFLLKLRRSDPNFSSLPLAEQDKRANFAQGALLNTSVRDNAIARAVGDLSLAGVDDDETAERARFAAARLRGERKQLDDAVRKILKETSVSREVATEQATVLMEKKKQETVKAARKTVQTALPNPFPDLPEHLKRQLGLAFANVNWNTLRSKGYRWDEGTRILRAFCNPGLVSSDDDFLVPHPGVFLPVGSTIVLDDATSTDEMMKVLPDFGDLGTSWKRLFARILNKRPKLEFVHPQWSTIKPSRFSSLTAAYEYWCRGTTIEIRGASYALPPPSLLESTFGAAWRLGHTLVVTNYSLFLKPMDYLKTGTHKIGSVTRQDGRTPVERIAEIEADPRYKEASIPGLAALVLIRNLRFGNKSLIITKQESSQKKMDELLAAERLKAENETEYGNDPYYLALLGFSAKQLHAVGMLLEIAGMSDRGAPDSCRRLMKKYIRTGTPCELLPNFPN